ncbi:hypothetical protein D3C87_168180 [compost metagenome]
MNRLFKTLVLWLLVLALPVQGYAAVMQMSCAPAMHESVAAEVAAVTAVSDEHAHHHGMQHEAAAVTDAATDATAKAATDMPSPHGKQTHMKCSVCAAGCMGMTALPSTPDWTFAAIGSSQILASPAPDFLGHIPDGIKRPPKSSLV